MSDNVKELIEDALAQLTYFDVFGLHEPETDIKQINSIKEILTQAIAAMEEEKETIEKCRICHKPILQNDTKVIRGFLTDEHYVHALCAHMQDINELADMKKEEALEQIEKDEQSTPPAKDHIGEAKGKVCNTEDMIAKIKKLEKFEAMDQYDGFMALSASDVERIIGTELKVVEAQK